MQWQSEYKSKLRTAEEAVKVVKNGDRVLTPLFVKDNTLSPALFARRNELKGVKILRVGHGNNPGWLDPGYRDIFDVTISMYVGDTARPLLDAKQADYQPGVFSVELKPFDERPSGERKDIDVFFVVTSTPDENGFVSFGADRWTKKEYCQRSRIVIAEVDERQMRTYGDNFMHVSEIDYIVEHTPPLLTNEVIKQMIATQTPDRQAKLWDVIKDIEVERRNEWVPVLMGIKTELLKVAPKMIGMDEPEEQVRKIAKFVAEIIKDGDVLQIGGGSPSSHLLKCGLLDGRKDMGIHTEMACRGMIKAMWDGVVTNERKNVHTGKSIFGSLLGLSQEEMKWCHNNPLIEQYSINYVAHTRTVASVDNYTAINSAISIDLTGQINAETIFGGRVWNGALGQVDQHIGAMLSKGGKAITCIRSTGLGGAVSRIVAQHEPGAVISIPRYYADYVVSEFGIARLLGKTQRERARELINITHPNFREDLKKEAEKLFG